MNYTERKNCIICNFDLNFTFFEEDMYCHSGHYQVEKNFPKSEYHKIPFNICVCQKCKTPQTKYLGNIDEIYKINHADNTGQIMQQLHQLNLEFILKYKNNIKNILEIGSSKGTLADLVINNTPLDYYIIEPVYFGDRKNKTIVEDFYENVDDSKIEANTLVISHVFEHFYQPIDILKKISKNKNLENFFLVFPDLEYYINNDILHVLNIEHTFYVDNQFLIDLFELYGFDLVEKQHHKNHSILFYFVKNPNYQENSSKEINFFNKNYNLEYFFNKIFEKVERFNKIIETRKNIYIWPASIHSIYLTIFGLDFQKIDGFLDNSINKIGKKVYGLDSEIYAFDEMVCKTDNTILLNGGVFNEEVKKLIGKNCFL